MITERKIQDAFYLRNQTRFTTIIPNCYPPGWFECDLMAITEAGYMYEFEIKLSRSDFLHDAKKGRAPEYLKEYYAGLKMKYGITKYERLSSGDKNGPSRFWYIVPEVLLDKIELPPFSGCLCVKEMSHFIFLKEIQKAPRLHTHKMNEEHKDIIRRNLYHRYWSERNRNNQAREVTG